MHLSLSPTHRAVHAPLPPSHSLTEPYMHLSLSLTHRALCFIRTQMRWKLLRTKRTGLRKLGQGKKRFHAIRREISRQPSLRGSAVFLGLVLRQLFLVLWFWLRWLLFLGDGFEVVHDASQVSVVNVWM